MRVSSWLIFHARRPILRQETPRGGAASLENRQSNRAIESPGSGRSLLQLGDKLFLWRHADELADDLAALEEDDRRDRADAELHRGVLVRVGVDLADLH